jgi:DNA-binding CsgD family transcriptional regulator
MKGHITKREQEVLDCLRVTPGADYARLAELLSTTVNCIRQHLFNLQRKGVMIGRGYFVVDETK